MIFWDPRPQERAALPAPAPVDFNDIVNAWGTNIPEFLIMMETMTGMSSTAGLVALPPPISNVVSSYFCVGENPDFMAYWTKAEDRLFKIRNGLNLAGVAPGPAFVLALDRSSDSGSGQFRRGPAHGPASHRRGDSQLSVPHRARPRQNPGRDLDSIRGLVAGRLGEARCRGSGLAAQQPGTNDSHLDHQGQGTADHRCHRDFAIPGRGKGDGGDSQSILQPIDQ